MKKSRIKDSKVLGLNIDLIKAIFKNSKKPYKHIRLHKYTLTELEKLVVDEILKTTDFKFNQVTINHNNLLQRHNHKNVGASKIMLLGDFEGGSLCVETSEKKVMKISETNKWFDFIGGHDHWVESFKGERISIVLYNRNKR